MNDKFDKDLTNHIREVFEDYSYPPADEGWAQLRKKFPSEEKKGKIAWLWWSSAAALLLVFLGVGLWLYAPQKAVQNMANNHVAKPVLKDNADLRTDNIKSPVLNDDSDNPSTLSKLNTNGSAKSSHGESGLAEVNKKPGSKAFAKPSPDIDLKQASVTAPGQNLTAGTFTAKEVTETREAVTRQPEQQQIAQVEKPVVADDAYSEQQVPATKSITQLLQDENKNIIAKKQPSVKQESKKINFSVYAATYLNYASGSANQVNAGAGFISDIKLGGNFKLSTGVALAQNSLRYDNGRPATAVGGFANANTPSANILRQDVSGFAVNSVSEVSQNYNARLIGLDVPVNIKYEFNPQKNDTYISAGLSSGTFIDERYTQNYTYKSTNLSNAAVTTQTQSETEAKSFNNFYFGKMLNVSFGVGYPIGKSNRLIIEPFLKYPLSGLGAQDLKFGAGGLNLKINFSGSKR